MEEQRSYYTYIILLLGLASVILAMASMYISQIVGINYGIGAGALIQSAADNVNVTSMLGNTVGELSALYKSLYETYLLFALAIGMVVSSFSLYIHRSDRLGGESVAYLTAHSVLGLVYIGVFFVILLGITLNATSQYYMTATYFSMFLCVIIDAYLLYINHIEHKLLSKRKRDISLEPSMPFSNLLNLRSELFSDLHDNLKIVDKHFNSMALSNLHRLISGNREIKSIEIVTSEEMLDAEFAKNYTDYKNELASNGIGVNVLVMTRADSEAQHERFLFDGTAAYKIPPLSIIHKRSEHITRLNVKDAQERFSTLKQRAMKYENYLVKKNQDSMKKAA